MDRKKLAIFIVLILGVISIIVYLLYRPNIIDDGQQLNISDNVTVMKQGLKDYERKQKKLTELNTNFGLKDDTEYETIEESPFHFNDPMALINFFFSAIIMDEMDLYLSAFHDETLMQELKEIEKPEERKQFIKDSIQKISRNNTLVEVEHIKTKTKSDITVVNVRLLYEDNNKVPLTLELKKVKDHHNHGVDYYIVTSIEEILNEI